MAATARIYRPTPANLARLAGVLVRGGLVAVPTETVYGLAADALNPAACRRIFRAKGRPTTDPLIVHVLGLAQAGRIAVLNEAARRLAAAFWPGPLTLVLPRQPGVPDLVTAGLPSVAVRVPSHPLLRRLLRRCGRPLAAPSANPFGYLSPTTATHVRAGLGHRIGHILDGGPAAIGVESTILDLRDPARPVLLRPGAISRAALAAVLGRRIRYRNQVLDTKRAAPAPGLLSRHYSPRTPLVLHARLPGPLRPAAEPRAAFLFFRRPPARLVGPNVFALTDTGDLTSAARRLFGRLRQLDAGGWSQLHVETAPGRSALALAINDRLARAAAK